MELSCPLGTTHCVPQEKFLRKPYNKSFVDQVLHGEYGWILASVSVHKLAKKELDQYPAQRDLTFGQ